jgi:hypothetical protein
VPFRDEDALQAAVIRAARLEWPDLWWFHPVGGMYQKPGIPDLILCVEGAFVGLELKNPHPGESDMAARDRATALQRKEIRAINRAGGTGRVVLTVEEAVSAIRQAVARHKAKQQQASEQEAQ